MNTNTHKVTVGKVVQYLILILMFLLLVGPFVWELSLSFKGKGDNVYAVPPYLMPKTPTLENYISVFKQVPVFHYMLNTLVISQFLIIRSIHLQNTLLAVALPGLCGAINILLMTNAFRSIPMELEEAAMVDGANLWQRFFHICVPQVKGTMTVVGIFAWNDFLWPVIAISDESKYTLTLGMNRLKGMFIQDPRLIAAGALVSLIPIIVFFCCFQRYFFRGLEQGGLKG